MDAPIDTSFEDASALVDSFTGRHAWASNFSGPPVHLEEATYPTREHAFAALKTLDTGERARVLAAVGPRAAKQVGRHVTLRPGWDDGLRDEVMAQVVAAGFTNPQLADALLDTGDALLIEGNRHHDQHFGDCTCTTHRSTPGANMLGRILMAERARLRGDEPNRWPRVALTGHRPEFLTQDQAQFARGELDRLAVKLATQHASTVAISGAARGADTWWATAAARAGLHVWAYVPFPTQAEGWDQADVQAWRNLLDGATRRVVVADRRATTHYWHRNEYMVRDSDVLIAVADPAKTTGGTAGTVAIARRTGVPVIYVDVRDRTTRILRPAPGSTLA